MIWRLLHRADPAACAIADRHYNRQNIGSPQFVPPGRRLVLTAETPTGKALWVTSWPLAEYVRHAWPGAWVCSAFRNEGAGLASEMIVQAIAATVHRYGPPPEPHRMITFLDSRKVRPIKVRGRDTFGRCWALAGFEHVGWTAGGLMAWQLRADRVPAPEPAKGQTLMLFSMAREAAALCGKGE
ncbi:MAG: hypothetical protein KGQ52_13410 [Alphaproteobacteria bacterium]|nr:hypothetical protein [Alphaproteobacteria bacterium]